ncbi:MAG: HAD family phosphatase [Clostridia bacterium]|nr:HAD family phosphatase [Deltaproteobacteria bacterium]
MRDVGLLQTEGARGVKVVLTDIDDTLTVQGKLVQEAYDALWSLHAAGIAVVPVTGRPAGWCDAIVRQWPVDAVIGENGAFVYYERNGVLAAQFHPNALADEKELDKTDPHARPPSSFPSHDMIEAIRERLTPARDAVLARFPLARVAKDQPYRIFDLAIDFREEPPDLGFEVAEEIRAELTRHGLTAKVSSIHVNAWFGKYDKLAMSRRVVRDLFKVTSPEQVVFVGDSPNDAPMFGGFPLSVGVANVRRFGNRMECFPQYVTHAEGGAGFAEVVRVLLDAKPAC